MARQRSRIAVLTTGGTISSRDSGAGTVAADAGQQLVSGVRVPDNIEVVPHDVFKLNSYSLTLADLRQIQDAVQEVLAWTGDERVDGIVLTHGTDTIEETAFLLNLVHDDDRPVVVTGAMFSADAPDTDGPRNIADSVCVAAAEAARGKGVLVVFAGTIFGAEGIRKLHTTSLSPFGAVGVPGSVGTVSQARVDIVMSPPRRAPMPRATAEFDSVRVEIVSSYVGADDRLIRLAATGSRGVVLLGTGAGNATRPLAAAVADLVADGVVVAVASRAPFGQSEAIYGNGGGRTMVESGAVMTGRLRAPQARILMALMLSQGASKDDVIARVRSYQRPGTD